MDRDHDVEYDGVRDVVVDNVSLQMRVALELLVAVAGALDELLLLVVELIIEVIESVALSVALDETVDERDALSVIEIEMDKVGEEDSVRDWDSDTVAELETLADFVNVAVPSKVMELVAVGENDSLAVGFDVCEVEQVVVLDELGVGEDVSVMLPNPDGVSLNEGKRVTLPPVDEGVALRVAVGPGLDGDVDSLIEYVTAGVFVSLFVFVRDSEVLNVAGSVDDKEGSKDAVAERVGELSDVPLEVTDLLTVPSNEVELVKKKDSVVLRDDTTELLGEEEEENVFSKVRVADRDEENVSLTVIVLVAARETVLDMGSVSLTVVLGLYESVTVASVVRDTVGERL